MFVVRLIKKNDFGSLVEVGSIEIQGVVVAQPDGGFRIPRQGVNTVPLSAVQKPPGMVRGCLESPVSCKTAA